MILGTGRFFFKIHSWKNRGFDIGIAIVMGTEFNDGALIL